MKEKVIARLVKGGFNEEKAAAMVEKYFDAVLRCYKDECLTVRQIADTVASFYCL